MSPKARRAAGLVVIALVAVWVLLAADPQRREAGAPAAGGFAGTASAQGSPPAATTHTSDQSKEAGPVNAYAQHAVLPTCVVADEPAPRSGLSEWRHTVLDTRFMLPADYSPTDLVDLAAALRDVAPYVAPQGSRLRAVVVEDLIELLAAAEKAGVALEIQSAYRSYEYQQRTFDGWVAKDGYEHALRSSARAGHSEHQLGTVFDVKTRGGPAAWDLTDWASTPEGAWMAANAWRFGFVMSYPPGKEDVTCYMYEPWHYRYLGRELAAAVQASGSTPREYLWALVVAAHEE